jgi:sulfoxide reductase catalytic subunit YedY
MLIRTAADIPSSEITDHKLYVRRREFLKASGLAAAGVAAGGFELDAQTQKRPPQMEGVVKGPFGTTEAPTPYESVTTYNNFYEFGTDKASPAQSAGSLRTRPWTVQVDGECNNPASYAIDDLIKRFDPTSRAKYVEFTTLNDSRQMPGVRSLVLNWPYREGLRLDEAMHPLAILAVGLYGVVLPNQNGAPLRLVVPWKYGFKGIKSIVRIRFVERQPVGSWQQQGASEYGFYSNVNPNVDHPRWSQASERRIGEFFKRKTLMFNGYADEVAGLYAGMDLRKYY